MFGAVTSVRAGSASSGSASATGATDWRDAYAFTNDWRADQGLGLVSSNLDAWTDVIGGEVLSAPLAGQRFTPDGAGWKATATNSCCLSTLTATALFALYAGTNPWTMHTRAYLPLTVFGRYLSIGASAPQYMSCTTSVTGDYTISRIPGGSATAAAALSAGTYTLSARYDPTSTGTELWTFVNGVSAATFSTTTSALTPITMTLAAFSTNGTTFSSFANATYYEHIVKGSAQSDADMLAVHNNLAIDWP